MHVKLITSVHLHQGMTKNLIFKNYFFIINEGFKCIPIKYCLEQYFSFDIIADVKPLLYWSRNIKAHISIKHSQQPINILAAPVTPEASTVRHSPPLLAPC